MLLSELRQTFTVNTQGNPLYFVRSWRYGWHDMRVFIMDKVLSFDFCSATAKICLIEEAGPIPMPFVTIEAALSY